MDKERPTDLLAHKLDAVVEAVKELTKKFEVFADDNRSRTWTLVEWVVKSLVLAIIALALGGKTIDVVQKLAEKAPASAIAESK